MCFLCAFFCFFFVKHYCLCFTFFVCIKNFIQSSSSDAEEEEEGERKVQSANYQSAKKNNK